MTIREISRFRLSVRDASIPPDGLHLPLPDSDGAALHLPAEALASVAAELGLAAGRADAFDRGRAAQDARLVALARLVAESPVDPHPLGARVVDLLAEALIVHLGMAHGIFDAPEARCRGGLAPWQSRRAQDLMLARLGERLNLTDVARHCGLSLSHFSRAFRKTVGVSPYAWLTGQRLIHAKALIRHADLALSEIALSCGFADQSHFTRTFRRHVGTSPGAWQRGERLRQPDARPRPEMRMTVL